MLPNFAFNWPKQNSVISTDREGEPGAGWVNRLDPCVI